MRGNERQTERSEWERGGLLIGRPGVGVVLYGTVFRTQRGEFGQPVRLKTDWVGEIPAPQKQGNV